MTSFSTSAEDIRKFGIVGFCLFGTLCSLAFWRQRPVMMALFGTLCFLCLSLIVLPVHLSFIYRGWMKVAHFISSAITTIILVVLYYTLITPFGLAKKLISGSPLPLSPDKNAPSYWVTRNEPAQQIARFLKRY